MMGLKLCAACTTAWGEDVYHPVAAFGENKNKPDGRSPTCRKRKGMQNQDSKNRQISGSDSGFSTDAAQAFLSGKGGKWRMPFSPVTPFAGDTGE